LRYCPQCRETLVDGTDHEGRQRWLCPEPSCGFVHWDNPVPVVAAIVEHEGRILLARNAQWPPEMFGLITGFLERDDPDPASGVLREVAEELGLRGRVAGFVGHYPFPRQNQLIIAYHVLAEGRITLDAELAEFRAIEPADLRPWPGATGAALRDWMEGRGLTPLPYLPTPLMAIPAWRAIDARLSTGGQPQPLQFRALRFAGVEAVINLALPDSPGALDDEAGLVAALGLRYHAVPVVWQAPTDADFDRFCALMRGEAGHRVFVHCVANKRAAVFVFLHRLLHEGVAESVARDDLEAVWQPDAVWSAFIGRQIRRAQGR
jgi:NTP pyrophosphohydrolases containing a Zn-finger, probably nucleic-acid-binding